jgi:hypothetical protein
MTAGFGIFAGAQAQMASRQAERQSDAAMNLFQQLHQIPVGAIQVPISAGTGVYQMNDLLMPKAGYMWSVRRLTASGYSAGSVIAYKGGVVTGTGANAAYSGGGEPFPFSAAGAATIGRGELLLDAGDALIIVCSTITLSPGFPGVQINGAADCFEKWRLPEYLGLGRK